jgi:hypothetical protein
MPEVSVNGARRIDGAGDIAPAVKPGIESAGPNLIEVPVVSA